VYIFVPLIMHISVAVKCCLLLLTKPLNASYSSISVRALKDDDKLQSLSEF